jgi:hypothetical protein
MPVFGALWYTCESIAWPRMAIGIFPILNDRHTYLFGHEQMNEDMRVLVNPDRCYSSLAMGTKIGTATAPIVLLWDLCHWPHEKTESWVL